MEFSADSTLLDLSDRTCVDDGQTLLFRWFAIDELSNVPLYPSFLVKRLGSLPDSLEHVVHVDM